MAHETIHLLAPSCGRNANNFEEGVACYFAAYYMKYNLISLTGVQLSPATGVR